jgi:hypothetical protein
MPANAPLRTLALIRIALLAGVLLFGGVCWYVHRAGPPPPPAPSTLRALRAVGMVVWAAAVVGIVVARLRLDGAARRRGGGAAAETANLRILAWAAGQAAALYGGVVYFLTGNPQWYVFGLTMMLGAFVVVPVRERGRG